MAFTPSEIDAARIAAIDAGIAYRRTIANRTPQYEWEVQRDRVRQLEQQLAAAKAEIRQLKREHAGQVIDDELIAHLTRNAKSTAEVHRGCAASYGEIAKRTVLRHLQRMARAGTIERVGDRAGGGWRLPRSKR